MKKDVQRIKKKILEEWKTFLKKGLPHLSKNFYRQSCASRSIAAFGCVPVVVGSGMNIDNLEIKILEERKPFLEKVFPHLPKNFYRQSCASRSIAALGNDGM